MVAELQSIDEEQVDSALSKRDKDDESEARVREYIEQLLAASLPAKGSDEIADAAVLLHALRLAQRLLRSEHSRADEVEEELEKVSEKLDKTQKDEPGAPAEGGDHSRELTRVRAEVEKQKLAAREARDEARAAREETRVLEEELQSKLDEVEELNETISSLEAEGGGGRSTSRLSISVSIE